jgi:hypothetical protein
VQRVLENTEVYRNRLAGHEQKLQILADLYRPDAPQAKVLDYVPPAQAATEAGVPLPQPKPSDGTTVTGGQAIIAAPVSTAPQFTSAGDIPVPKPPPER